MELNISTFMYLFVRLLPFILVCFFSISSIFSNDVKGIVYLCGLLLTVGIGFMASALIGMFTQNLKETDESIGIISSDEESNNKKDLICKILSLGFSSLTIPIGELITSFTFIYLLATMILTSTDD